MLIQIWYIIYRICLTFYFRKFICSHM